MRLPASIRRETSGSETLATGKLAHHCSGFICAGDSLAIGAPSTTFNEVAAAGAVWVIDPPIGGGLDPASLSPILPQAPLSIGSPQIGEYFGNALAIADFNDDGLEDLAIGAFEYDDGSEGNAGAVQVLYQSDFLFLDGFD